MLLMQDPELMMLDEPVAGMSVNEREQTAELLKPNQQEPLGDRDRARHGVRRRRIAHKVTVLHQGKMLAEGDHGRGAERPEGDRSLSRPLKR